MRVLDARIMTSVLCIGEALIDFIAQTSAGDLSASELFRRAAGGAVANVAVGIARLGSASHFIGALSDDPFGHFLLRTLSSENVNVDNVRTVHAHTTLALVARGKAGARDFFFIREPGADSCLTSSDVPSAAIARARVVHFGGVLLSSDPARSACLVAAASAASAGRLVSFDPNARPSLFASTDAMQEALQAGCSAAHLIKLSEEDLAAMGMRLEEAPQLFNKTTHAVVVSLGARGCRWWYEDGSSGEIAAPKVDAVDTTGAGDAMMAAILWRLDTAYDTRLSAETIADAARFGCAAGAAACLVEGAIPSLPTRPTLDAMLSRVPETGRGSQ